MQKGYSVLAYYQLSPLVDPHAEIARHQLFFVGRDVTARVYISEQGINGQLCAADADAAAYMEWMHSRTEFKPIHFKIHKWHEQVFPRLTIKYRRQLVAIDADIDMQMTGEHVSPKKWKEMLEQDDGHILLDVRNDYEWKLGHFEGAELPPCETFRDFDRYAENLKENNNPDDTPVMMYCTGGIRCELYSALLKEKGFKKVYQLDGGIINYGLQEGSSHWKGKLFVFDDRLSVPVSEEETEVIGTCHHCGGLCESYYNCANMDCNRLFLCCASCAEKTAGCCQPSCREAQRVRPYQQQLPHKPFKRQNKGGLTTKKQLPA